METIVLTPTWSGLLPALLDARANIKRRLFAEECDGKADGWCSVHESEWERDTDTVCRYDEREWLNERRRLSEELTNLDGEFAKMAKAADMMVEVQKVIEEAGENWTPDTRRAITAILTTKGA